MKDIAACFRFKRKKERRDQFKSWSSFVKPSHKKLRRISLRDPIKQTMYDNDGGKLERKVVVKSPVSKAMTSSRPILLSAELQQLPERRRLLVLILLLRRLYLTNS